MITVSVCAGCRGPHGNRRLAALCVWPVRPRPPGFKPTLHDSVERLPLDRG